MTFVIRVILPFITVSWAITVDAKGQHSLCRIILRDRCLAVSPRKSLNQLLLGCRRFSLPMDLLLYHVGFPVKNGLFGGLPPVVDKAKDHILDGSWLHPVKHISQISRTSLVHSHMLQLAIAKIKMIKRQQQPKKTAAWTHSALDDWVQSLRPSIHSTIHSTMVHLWSTKMSSVAADGYIQDWG